MNRKLFWVTAALILLLSGCKVKYSFTGGSVSPDAQTYSVIYFPNNAPMVAPMLSSTLTDALIDRFDSQTRLVQVREGGDLNIEGEITGYTSTPAAISATDESAATNRLTITVTVRFTNTVEPQYNYSRSFSQSLEYDTRQPLQQVEPSLIPDIVDMLADDIINAAISNW